jgi:hypothetical protein
VNRHDERLDGWCTERDLLDALNIGNNDVWGYQWERKNASRIARLYHAGLIEQHRVYPNWFRLTPSITPEHALAAAKVLFS